MWCMAKIIDSIREANGEKRHFFCFEFAAPTTEAATLTLYDKIERFSSLDPLFCSITWGDYGCTADASIEIAATSQSFLSLNFQVHLTGYSVSKSDVYRWLCVLKEKGIRNVLLTRGHTVPIGHKRVDFPFASDLVKYVREQFGHFFCIAVVGLPESSMNSQQEMRHLADKVALGADYIITPPIFSANVFAQFCEDCKRNRITCPIIPSVLPIAYPRQLNSFNLSKQSGVSELRQRLENASDEEERRAESDTFFQNLVHQLLHSSNCNGVYFYTLNSENTITSIIKGLNIVVHRAMPWKRSENEERRRVETARPVHWSTQMNSYMARTAQWKDFKSGSIWTTERSRLLEDGSGLHARLLLKTRAKRCAQFLAVRDITDIPEALTILSSIFVQYLDGVGAMPWAEGLSEETGVMLGLLKPLNARGLFTICSQPQVNGEGSSNKTFGWGPAHGTIYQKAYLEFFCSPGTAQTVFTTVSKYPSLRFMAMRSRDGHRMVKSNWKIEDNQQDPVHRAFGRGVTTITWGVFPGREVMQPTIVSIDTFRVWGGEAFELWAAPFAHLDKIPPVIRMIQEEWLLFCVVDNTYTESPSPMERAVAEICCKIPPIVNRDASSVPVFSSMHA